VNCTAAVHDLLRASGVAFRASCRLTFRFWSVNDAGQDEEAQAGNCTRCESTIAIPVRLLDGGTPYERAARARKVAKMLALVPPGATRREMNDLADALVRFDDDARARWASAAGCTPPSIATWADLVALSRARLTAQEIMARAAGEGAVIS
jgi:hypothetical protein